MSSTVHALPKFARDYIVHVFVPGYAKLLAKEPWFADACVRGTECPECPEWLGQWLCAEGLDRAKILALLRVPESHTKVVDLLYNFANQMDVSMVAATDAQWDDGSGEACDPETSATVIGIVADGKIKETIVLGRDPTSAIKAIEHFVGELVLSQEESGH